MLTVVTSEYMHDCMCVSACVYFCMSVCACVRGSLSVCYRLYAEEVYARMAPHQLPEILRLPLEQTVLQVRAMRQHPTHSCSRLTMSLCLSVCLFLCFSLSLCLSLYLSLSFLPMWAWFACRSRAWGIRRRSSCWGGYGIALPAHASIAGPHTAGCVCVCTCVYFCVCMCACVCFALQISLSLALALSVY
jgi:hypothetical protein